MGSRLMVGDVPTGVLAASWVLSYTHGSALHRTYAGATKEPVRATPRPHVKALTQANTLLFSFTRTLHAETSDVVRHARETPTAARHGYRPPCSNRARPRRHPTNRSRCALGRLRSAKDPDDAA